MKTHCDVCKQESAVLVYLPTFGVEACPPCCETFDEVYDVAKSVNIDAVALARAALALAEGESK